MRLPRIPTQTVERIGRIAGAACAVYLLGIAAWFAWQQLVGDATWWLFLANALALYLFVPLPAALLIAAWRRNLTLVGGSLAAVALFALLWGGLFWPRGHPEPEGPVVTVMTYNLLGHNLQAEGIVEALRASGADVIGLLELNPTVADAVEAKLLNEYPYQLLEPRVGVSGSGVISRLPFHEVQRDLRADGWISRPIALQVDLDGNVFLFLQVHSASGASVFRAREQQAEVVSRLAQGEQLPLIVAGDFNATDRNDSHATLTRHLRDAWREAGSGFGHTFPGASATDTPWSSRPDIFGVAVPRWLVRIDYVFISKEWQAIDARIGPWDGYSDHRPVIAEVALRGGD